MAKVELNIVDNCIEDERFDRAIRRIATFYEDELYDEYEEAIERYAKQFGLDENFVEDAAIDYFYYGPDCG